MSCTLGIPVDRQLTIPIPPEILEAGLVYLTAANCSTDRPAAEYNVHRHWKGLAYAMRRVRSLVWGNE